MTPPSRIAEMAEEAWRTHGDQPVADFVLWFGRVLAEHEKALRAAFAESGFAGGALAEDAFAGILLRARDALCVNPPVTP